MSQLCDSVDSYIQLSNIWLNVDLNDTSNESHDWKANSIACQPFQGRYGIQNRSKHIAIIEYVDISIWLFVHLLNSTLVSF